MSASASWRELHHRNADLVFEARIDNGPAAEYKVVHVVKSVKVPDGGYAVLFKELRVKGNNIGRLLIKADHVDAPGQGLKVSVRANRLSEGVHNIKGVLPAVEEY